MNPTSCIASDITLTGGKVSVKGSGKRSEIAERMEEARERLDLKQKEVAEKVGSSTSNVSGYEGGVAPPAAYIAAFCRELGVNPLWLLLNQGPFLLRDAEETGGPADAQYLAREIRQTISSVMGELSDDELSDLRDASGASGNGTEDSEGNGGE